MKQSTLGLIHLRNKLYYSQNREDLLLEAFFPEKDDGFYVDIGAYDPDVDSVTKLFYKKGWRGINVEPQADRYHRFVRKRPRDINLNCGISSVEKKDVLREYKNGGLSTFSPDLKKEYADSNDNPDVSSFSDVTVEIRTLKSIFERYKVEVINFMKVDVEGLELEVLKGNDWSRYRPEVICIEANHVVDDWRGYIISCGYHLVFFDGLNEYYAASEEIRNGFDYVAHIIFRRGGGVAFNDFQSAKTLAASLEKNLTVANGEFKDLLRTHQETQQRLKEVNEELSSVHFLAARLIHVILYKLHMRREK